MKVLIIIGIIFLAIYILGHAAANAEYKRKSERKTVKPPKCPDCGAPRYAKTCWKCGICLSCPQNQIYTDSVGVHTYCKKCYPIIKEREERDKQRRKEELKKEHEARLASIEKMRDNGLNESEILDALLGYDDDYDSQDPLQS